MANYTLTLSEVPDLTTYPAWATTSFEKQMYSRGWDLVTNINADEAGKALESYRCSSQRVILVDQAFDRFGNLMPKDKAIYIERKSSH